MKKLIFAYICLFLAIPCYAKIIYVDVNTPADNDGSSWSNAYKYLQDALDDAVSGDEIWVSQGTYKPTKEVGGTDDRYKTFQMKNGVAIYGGFPNMGEADFEDRDPNIYKSILSGDLNGDDGPDFANNAENSYHVFYHPYGTNLDSTAILDGCTITAGNADGPHPIHRWGAGMYNFENSPMVTNCTFTGNLADSGSGMYNSLRSSPTVINCIFKGNSADYTGGGMYNNRSDPNINNCTFSNNSAFFYGGGMINNQSGPTVTNCTFTGNSAYWGGGMDNYLSNSIIINCTFTSNSARYNGGGISNLVSDPNVINCNFIGNVSDANGGGMYNKYSNSNVTNCTFTGNSAYWGGGMYNSFGSDPNVTNCILWGNTATNAGPQIYNDADSSSTVSYSDIQGGCLGPGNIDEDPCFVDADGADDIFGTEDDNLRLPAYSPCIDVGDNSVVPPGSTDLDGNPRIVNEIVDMGAYEFQDPIELLLGLIDYVNDLNLPKGTANSLLAKLDNALKLLEDEDENNDGAAINLLDSFINTVEAQSGKKIPETDADALIGAAEQIIELLSTE
ncbi:MAG: choice-of-anchor Q domain-containing protein [Planctomycetota bacterium]|jgi:hypothetical protein